MNALALFIAVPIMLAVLVALEPISRHTAERALAERGYVQTEPLHHAFAVCLKGRTPYHFVAIHNGRGVSGKICVGGFMRASITEDRA